MDIGTLGGGRTQGVALNDSGQVTGNAIVADGARHAFRHTATGGMEDLGTLSRKGGSDFDSWGFDINAGGVVVGKADDKNVAGLIRFRAFVARPGEETTDLGVLGDGQYSRANSINDAGWIVGDSQLESSKFGGRLAGDFHAFVWSPDFGMARLEDLVVDMPAGFDGRLEPALVINNTGQVAGNALWDDGRAEAFLLTPVGIVGGKRA
jgi:probable HAF family extracellular repeat protein